MCNVLEAKEKEDEDILINLYSATTSILSQVHSRKSYKCFTKFNFSTSSFRVNMHIFVNKNYNVNLIICKKRETQQI